MFKFEKLEVWEKAINLCNQVFEISNQFTQREQFSIGEQLRRASLSVPTNIAEGTGREGPKENKYFFNVAKGSVYEVVSLLHIARDRGHLETQQYDELYASCDEIPRMLSGLINK